MDSIFNRLLRFLIERSIRFFLLLVRFLIEKSLLMSNRKNPLKSIKIDWIFHRLLRFLIEKSSLMNNI